MFKKLLNVDERKPNRENINLKIRALLYVILASPHQYTYLSKRDESIASGKTPYETGVPWITYDAAAKLKDILNEGMKVFEYGAGGSTAYFRKHTSEVHSVEHNKDWYQKINKELDLNKKHTLRLIPPTSEKTDFYISNAEPGKSFEKYVKSIDIFEDDYFDIVMVDGRARVACALHAASKVNPGGYLVLDNSDRDDYQTVFDSLKDWRRESFFGIAPYETLMSETTFWKKPS